MRSLTEIGTLLRLAREEQGLSLELVQSETKIRLRYLEALEAGDESIIPGEVYLKGFLRFYANHLGLDGHALVEEFKDWREAQEAEQEALEAQPPAKASRPPRVQSASAPTPESSGAPVVTPRRRLVIGTVAILAVVALLVTGAWALGRRGTPSGANVTPPPGSGTPNEPGGSAVDPPAPKIEVTFADLGNAGLRYVTTAATIKVEVEASGRCWVNVTADGQVIVGGQELIAGSKAVWEAKDKLVVVYGNLGGVKYSVSGIAQVVAGGDGAVRTVSYERK